MRTNPSNPNSHLLRSLLRRLAVSAATIAARSRGVPVPVAKDLAEHRLKAICNSTLTTCWGEALDVDFVQAGSRRCMSG